MKNKFKILIFVLVGLLVIGFFVFQYLMPGKEPAPQTQDTSDFSEEIGQMLMIGFRGTIVDDNSYITKVIDDIGIGGVVLFDKDAPSNGSPKNIQTKEQLKQLITDLQTYSEIPLFVAIDAEGGIRNRYGFINVPTTSEMAKHEFTNTERIAKMLGAQLKEIGFNMNLAPVVDLNINPDNPIIGALGRSFSADPLEAAGHAKGFIEGLRTQDIIAVVKHFPGHGSSVGDSHLGMVDVTDTYQAIELFPYHLLLGEEVLDAVMTAHIINKNIDENYPATLSARFINDILRIQVGFMGVVISDDILMQAITDNYTLEQAVVKAVNAGVDVILLSNNSTQGYDEQLPYRVKDIIIKAVREGAISETRIKESYQAIMALKKQFNICCHSER